MKDQENLNSLINYYVRAYRAYPEREPIMVQEYLEEVQTKGDVRILLLNGEIVGAMRRKPSKGDFQDQYPCGGPGPIKHEITDDDRAICRVIQRQSKKRRASSS